MKQSNIYLSIHFITAITLIGCVGAEEEPPLAQDDANSEVQLEVVSPEEIADRAAAEVGKADGGAAVIATAGGGMITWGRAIALGLRVVAFSNPVLFIAATGAVIAVTYVLERDSQAVLANRHRAHLRRNQQAEADALAAAEAAAGRPDTSCGELEAAGYWYYDPYSAARAAIPNGVPRDMTASRICSENFSGGHHWMVYQDGYKTLQSMTCCACNEGREQRCRF